MDLDTFKTGMASLMREAIIDRTSFSHLGRGKMEVKYLSDGKFSIDLKDDGYVNTACVDVSPEELMVDIANMVALAVK